MNHFLLDFRYLPPPYQSGKTGNWATDTSSKPHHIAYALSDLETALALSVRQSSWLPLDEVFEMLRFDGVFMNYNLYRRHGSLRKELNVKKTF